MIITFGSLVSWIFLLAEKKENREAYGLRAHNGKISVLMVILFLLLYFGRIFLMYIAGGQLDEFIDVFKSPVTYRIHLYCHSIFSLYSQHFSVKNMDGDITLHRFCSNISAR